MKIIFIFLSSILLIIPALASATETSDPSLTVHLLDYLAKDYAGAVKDGKVVSESEFAEQVEFAETVSKNSNNINLFKANPAFIAQVEQLATMIKSKGPSSEVTNLARKLQQQAIDLAGIEAAPRAWPDLQKGAKLFQTQCTACHGTTGQGDGLAGINLVPKPANFHDPELIKESSPYKFFNTIRLGVPGTGMVAFSGLSDEEIWSLAFFIKSLGHEIVSAPSSEIYGKYSLQEVSSLTDFQLLEKLSESEKDESKRALIVAGLRTNPPSDQGPKNSLVIAQKLLSESFEFAKKKDFPQASTLALRSYLEGIEPLEPKMKANVPGLTEEIEGLMANYRSLISNSAPEEKIQASYQKVQTKLDETKELLAEKKMSPGIAFGAAFTIFLREGFEAVLIIIVLLSILKAMGQTEAIKWVHAGWITATALGVLTWFASGLLLAMSGLSRELLEGGISVLAVLVLLYVGFWLHRYSEAKKWREFLEAKLKTGLHSGSYFVLAVVSFLAVFREAFEVVLFLRAIWMDLDGPGQNIASLGILSSFAVLIGLSYFAVKESKKLPIGKLFEICSWTMIVLAFILAGKGIHSLQEAGLVPVTNMPFHLRFDLVGFFPSVQTVLAQIVVIVVFGALLLRDKKEELAAG